MGKFVRMINNGIIDVFSLKIEDISHCYYHFSVQAVDKNFYSSQALYQELLNY